MSRHPLAEYGVSPSCLSDAAASKMDETLAAKLFSLSSLVVWKVLPYVGLHAAVGDLVDRDVLSVRRLYD